MLAVLASIALFVGGVQTAMILSDEDRLGVEETQAPIVEVSPVESDEVSHTRVQQ